MTREAEASAALVAWWAASRIAFVFGLVAAKTNFCTMGALSDIVNMGHWGRMRMWLLAIAVAIVGTSVLSYAGLVDLSKSVTQRPVLPWLSLIVGGLVFGVGMTLAGGCANKNLIRAGRRQRALDGRAGVHAHRRLHDAQGPVRPVARDASSIRSASTWASAAGPTKAWARRWPKLTGMDAKPALLGDRGRRGASALLVFVFKDKRFRANACRSSAASCSARSSWPAGTSPATSAIGENPETLETVYFATNTRTLESLSFVAPLAFSLELLMLWTDASLHVTFGIASVLGVIAGSAAYALATQDLPLGGLRLHGRPAQPARRAPC